MAIELLYNAKKAKILLWKNGEDIAFKATYGISAEIKNDIKRYKSILLQVLAYNGIDSESKARNVLYYKLPEDIRSNVLSAMQQGIYLQSKLDKQKNTYNVPVFVLLKNTNINLLKQALFVLLKQHPILRMCDISDTFNYRILNIEEFFIPTVSVDMKNIENICKQKSKYEFDLNTGKLINIEIIKINNTDNVILNLTHHHILTDGYSIGLIIAETFVAYSNIAKKNDLIEKQINYFDYAEFQNYNLQTQEYKKAIKYLTSKLDTAELLQLKKSNLGIFDNQAHSFEMVMSTNVCMKLQTISKKNQVSLYSVLFTSLYHVLSNYVGGKTHFPIGINISNRTFELNKVIGPCISTLALIPEYNHKSSLINNIKQINNEILYLHEYNHINLNVLAKNFTTKTSVELEELMRVMFTMYNIKQNFLDISQIQNTEIEYEIINQKEDENIEKFGISIDAIEQNTELYFSISYAKNLYDYDYIKSIMNSFKTFLENINEENLLQPIDQIELLTNEQYLQIMHQSHNTKHKYLSDKTIHQLFENQVNKTPDSIAIVYEDIKLTYKKLNEEADRLAKYLTNKYNITSDTLIPLYLNRSEHMLIAIIAVLKAGGAYVPIDTSYPDERTQYIFKDINAQLVLTNHTYNQKLANMDSIDVICIDNPVLLQKLTMQSAFNPNIKVTANNLAYVIYTSGTTGLPKGVMIEHRGVVNLKYDLTNKYKLGKNEIILQLASYVFDASIEQIILSLLNGHTLLLIKEHLWLDKKEFYCYLNKNKVTHIEATPTLLEQYNFNKIPSLKRIVSGGEYFSIECYRNIAMSNIKNIINTYGPTETTINAVTNVIKNNNICIGTPITNTQCYVLNKSLTLLPIGAVGELYIGGIGLARGYLNKADLTAEKFIADPFNKNSRLYKTGDLVRWLPGYNLEYLGRNDCQVKIRGYRIELKEIETILSLYPGIRQTVVCAKTRFNADAAKYLIGYYVSDFKLNEEDILSYLKNKLPEYMVPSMLVYLDNLPTTVNGKLDISALPDPKFTDTINYIAPRNELEFKICNIWSQVLGLPEDMLSIDTDFFRLGGNSVLAIKLVHILNNQFVCDKPINVKDLYINSTIIKLSAFIQNNNTLLEEKIVFENEVKLDHSITPITSFSICKVSNKYNVFITGGTGFIGSHLLKELTENSLVDKIFCLVVADTENEAIDKINHALHLYKLGNFGNKIIPVVGTLSKKYFGLNMEEFNRIADVVDIVIHNATFMNHLATYHAVKQVNVQGTEEVLRFACAKRQKTVNFVSTTNIFNTVPLNKIYDEDTIIDNEEHYYSNGYSSSKWIAEGLCNIARQRGINCNIYRLSLILPNSVNPIYPKQQWFGRFIKACLDFGIFPNEFKEFEIQFACVDEIAKAITYSSTDLTNIKKNFHLFSKNTLSFAGIFERMKILFNCKDVTLSYWLNKYQFAKLSHNMPIISFIEDVTVSSDIASINYRFLSEKTHNFFKKYNTTFDAYNDNYIDSLLTQAKVTIF